MACGEGLGDERPGDGGAPDSGPVAGDPGPVDGGADAGPDPTCRGRWPGLRIGTALDDEVRALAFDHEGRLVVGGFEGGRSHVDTPSPISNAPGFVSWFTEAGVPVGRAALETDDADVIEALAVAPDGRILAAASTLGTRPGQTSGGQYDAVFAVFALGRPGPVQAVHVGGVHPERPHRLVVRGDRWMAGETLGSWLEDEPADGSSQAFVVRIGDEGAATMAGQKNTTGVDVALTVRVHACDRGLVGGWTNGALVDHVPSAGGRDGFVLQARLRPWIAR